MPNNNAKQQNNNAKIMNEYVVYDVMRFTPTNPPIIRNISNTNLPEIRHFINQTKTNQKPTNFVKYTTKSSQGKNINQSLFLISKDPMVIGIIRLGLKTYADKFFIKVGKITDNYYGLIKIYEYLLKAKNDYEEKDNKHSEAIQVFINHLFDLIKSIEQHLTRQAILEANKPVKKNGFMKGLGNRVRKVFYGSKTPTQNASVLAEAFRNPKVLTKDQMVRKIMTKLRKMTKPQLKHLSTKLNKST
jgi:hypothetical protein